VAFSRKVLSVVASIVLIAALALVPFIDRLANAEGDLGPLGVYFLVLASSTSINFLLTHRVIVLIADQRIYITKWYGLLFQGARLLLQVGALLSLHSYFAYVSIQAISTVALAVFLHWRGGRAYPYIRERCPGPDREVRQRLLANVRAMMVYRVSGVALNSTDAILAVSILGAATGGRLANYMFAIGAVLTLTDIGTTSLSASVGHLVVNARKEVRLAVFRELGLLSGILCGLISVILALTLDDIVSLWLGQQYLLSSEIAPLLALNLYVYGLTVPVMIFRQATGLFRDAKYILFGTAMLNLALSVILAQAYGLAGILVATFLARMLGNFWWEPYLLLKNHLEGSFGRFCFRQLLYLGLALLSFWIILGFTRTLPGGHWETVAIETASACAATFAIYFSVFCRSSEYRDLRRRLTALIRRP
jgi:O-antigen/teichoic acid export membrane protein